MSKILILSSLFVALPAVADEVWIAREPASYERRHFYMGIEGLASAVLNETGPHQLVSHGGGLNLFLGGRLSRRVALEFGWSPTFHSQAGDELPHQLHSGISLSALTLDVKIYPFLSWVQPYFAVGPAAYILTDGAMSYLAGGGGWQIGGGVDFWLMRHLSVGAKMQYRGAALTDFDGRGDDTYISMLTFGLNLTGRF